VCILVSALLVIIGSTVFGVVLGPKWEGVGLFAAILLPMFAWDVVGYVYAQVLVVRRRYRLQFVLDLVRAVVVIGGLVALLEAGSTVVMAAVWLSATMCAFYAAVFYVGHRELMCRNACSARMTGAVPSGRMPSDGCTDADPTAG
jgi:O-antigen/teichoic acid export membrane protein